MLSRIRTNGLWIGTQRIGRLIEIAQISFLSAYKKGDSRKQMIGIIMGILIIPLVGLEQIL